MAKLFAVLLVALIGTSASNSIDVKSTHVNPFPAYLKAGTISKLPARQTCVLPSDYPLICNNTRNQLYQLIVQAHIDPLTVSTAAVASLLDQFCVSECLTPLIQYANCVGEPLTGDFYNSGFCGESDGDYCFVVWLNGYSSGIELIETPCGTSCSCAGNCQQTLQATVDYLGCCAASLYGNTVNTIFSRLISPKQFSTCDVSLGQECAGALNAAVGNQVGIGLLVVFATLCVTAAALAMF